MELSNKIQCPTCGATSSYTETEPGQYKCGYCLSGWEQLSILPEKDNEQEFFEKCKEIFDEQQKLTPEKPKYSERSFANITIFFSFFSEIKNTTFREQLLPKFNTLVEEQIKEYAEQGIDTNVDREKIFTRYPDKFVLVIYLAELNYMSAKALALTYDEKEKLEEAILKLKTAQQLHGPSINEWQGKISKTTVGILQRLGEEKRAFEYIYSLFESQNIRSYKAYHHKSSGFPPEREDLAHFIKDREAYSEDVKFLFEDIIFSDEYIDWESKQVKEQEDIIDEEESLKILEEEIETASKISEKTSELETPKKLSIWQKLFGA
ncbi:hypothetical protein Aeqsu_1351 [Aequorivita sublithincola DSM 14238]|uniref:Uncharacterized protein n=1 Tax=Aequorivita sublithincola (strain DSM 14238 / LMG 21431 / ACAM 643 / 9-3) TaxID=746697 RepID=I3YV26_AEQSU|nr:hypothetical protein [Aequorivita sublithincola]AFL80844.1 hypothetical protein Aeqsu_1351 [Aequorivita sublithincola DSM 14238]